VEAVCGRVIIIARGRIVLDDQLVNLRRQGAITVEVRGPASSIRAVIQTIPGVERTTLVREEGAYSCFEVQTRDSEDLREAMSQKLVTNGWPLRQIDLRRSSLEERFAQVVGQGTIALAQAEAS
jgi:ABC-2 type transport system ATP-binding protein